MVERTLSVRKLMEDMELIPLYAPENLDYKIKTVDINRPGLQLAGFYEHFQEERVQVMGNVEYAYLEAQSLEVRRQMLDRFLSHAIPVLIVTRDIQLPDLWLELAKKHQRFILLSNMATTKFISKLALYVNGHIAPVEVIHGVLVDVSGLGVLIRGDSAVGKSETALDLIRQGHRLVADDAVEIARLDEILVGRAPELTQNLLEIRGLGLLDIKSLYGIGAVKNSKKIDMVVYLEIWKEDKYYDRLGLETEHTHILGLPIETVTIPVKPGRNISIMVEIAARNFRQKYMGYNAAEVFSRNLLKSIADKSDAESKDF